MATQLKHTDIRPIPVSANEAYRSHAPRPNVRVAFIAGDATNAVHEAMAKLPAETRDGTLDDLVWDQGVGAQAVSPAFQALLDTAAKTLADHNAYSSEVCDPAGVRFYALRDARSDETDAAKQQYDAAEERINELLDLDTAAQNAVAVYPVSNAAELTAKLAFMIDREMLMTQDFSPQLRADAVRVGQASAVRPTADGPTDGVSPELVAMIADADAKEVAYLTDQRVNVDVATQRYEASKGTADEAEATTGFHDAHTHHDELVVSCCNAQYAVCNHPVTTAVDLRAKLAFMKRHLMGDGMDWTDTLLDDAERIAAGDQPSALRSLLHQRNAIWDGMAGARLSDEQGAAGCREINNLENRILAAPAVTSDDAIVKMIAALGIVACGVELEDVEAAELLVDARRHFGIGQVLHHLVDDAGSRRDVIAAQDASIQSEQGA